MYEPKHREHLVFDALLESGEDTIRTDALPGALRRVGLRLDDPRLGDALSALTAFTGSRAERPSIGRDDFGRLVGRNILMIERALMGELVIPDFGAFEGELRGVFQQTRELREGAVANYIPQLGRVDPEKYAAAVCTIDGQRAEMGDASEPFCIQSSCKPINYCLALEQHGAEIVHRHVGCEPSGQHFNELTLNKVGRPHNPMINAGAIMSCSLIRPELPIADRFDYVLDMWRRLAGGRAPGFSNSTYLSERQTADRNFALGYFMRENGAFPAGADLIETLEFYFQCCSLEVTAELVSVVAATLANGGVCPLTGERVFRPDTVQKCLSMMFACGMYDFSGEWGFSIGLPAKSGVSGVIMIVVPNVLGLCLWSPRLDAHGNSVRGVAFAQELVRKFNFHNYDNLIGGLHGKQDPRRPPEQYQRNLLVDLCWAASEGDLDGIRRLRVQGAALDQADYDGRTALHLAASEGRAEVVEYLVARGVDPSRVDRWGNTPLDDARRDGHLDVIAILERTSESPLLQAG